MPFDENAALNDLQGQPPPAPTDETKAPTVGGDNGPKDTEEPVGASDK